MPGAGERVVSKAEKAPAHTKKRETIKKQTIALVTPSVGNTTKRNKTREDAILERVVRGGLPERRPAVLGGEVLRMSGGRTFQVEGTMSTGRPGWLEMRRKGLG